MESHLKNNLIQLFVRKVLTYLSQDHLQKNVSFNTFASQHVRTTDPDVFSFYYCAPWIFPRWWNRLQCRQIFWKLPLVRPWWVLRSRECLQGIVPRLECCSEHGSLTMWQPYHRDIHLLRPRAPLLQASWGRYEICQLEYAEVDVNSTVFGTTKIHKIIDPV